MRPFMMDFRLVAQLSPLPPLYVPATLSSLWYLENATLFQLHAVHFVKTCLPISLNLPASLIFPHLIWLTKIQPSQCQQIVLDFCCWLLLHLELTLLQHLPCWSITMSPLNYGLLKKRSCICLEHPALCLAHGRCLNMFLKEKKEGIYKKFMR